MKNYSVSVCLACHNGEDFLYKQIDSILKQLKDSDELLVSIDNTTDNSKNIVCSFNDKRIKIFDVNFASAIKNFEFLLKQAKNNYIFFSDQDDIWKPGKVQICLHYLDKYDLIVSDCEIIDEKDNVVLSSYFYRRKSGKGLLKNFLTNTYLGCCMAINKEVLKLVLPFPKKIPMHDIWLGFVGECFLSTYFVKNILVSYRTHNKNISPTSSGISYYNLYSKFLFRWNIVKYLPLLLYRKWKI